MCRVNVTRNKKSLLMKCKSWSNKINNFVVRKLKSIKINGQQQSASTTATAAAAIQQQQQQYLTTTTCSTTMPAMPKEKAATAVSLSEGNFSEYKFKEIATSTALVVASAAAAMATPTTTASANNAAQAAATSNNTATTNHRQQQHHTNNYHQQQMLSKQLQQQQQRNSICGCGAISSPAPSPSPSSAVNSYDNGSDEVDGYLLPGNNSYWQNAYSASMTPSPLAAALNSEQMSSSSLSSSPQRHSKNYSSSNNNNNINNNNNNNNNNSSKNKCNCAKLRASTSSSASSASTASAASSTITQTAVTTTTTASTNSSTTAAATATAATATTTRPVASVTPPKRSANDYIFGRIIGEGSFSTVYLAVDVVTKREYAIKVCSKNHILRERKQEYVRREREVMHMLTNVPGFVNLSCTFQDPRSLYFVMTYAQNGDLLPYINKVGSFDANCTRHYAAELVLACEQMHRNNIVHRDLKPENILLDEDMHILIADFGSAKLLTEEDRAAADEEYAEICSTATLTTPSSAAQQQQRSRSRARQQYLSQDDETTTRTTSTSTSTSTSDDASNNGGGDDDTGSDDVDSPSRRPRYTRRRRVSFVGTAQYVSPEVLHNGLITPASDLWALGCIIYQMVSGLPPFRASNDYNIFKQILACKLDFPEGFDEDAEDLVRKLLKLNPYERLGAQDIGDLYTSIRAHPFFTGVNFDTVLQRVPPTIYPYLPGVSKDEELRLSLQLLEHLEPGLDQKQLTRLLGMELGTLSAYDFNEEELEKKTENRNIYDLSAAEKQKRLLEQQSDKWHVFADNEVILKKGYINKRKGLFARKRMLLLTTGPRLIYIDPVQMNKKGEIPWSPELHVELKNFKIFFVHTPNRTYYLEDPEGYALEWNDAIESMHRLTYQTQQQQQTQPAVTISSASSTASASSLPIITRTASRGSNCSSSAVSGSGGSSVGGNSLTTSGSATCATSTATPTQVKTA